MKISVIIPVYNAKRFLQETVNSVLAQPYKDIDIVLVDDGSTDGSALLCDELSNQSDRVVAVHKANGGVSSARNAGIQYLLEQGATGYVMFLDGDDCWTANFWDDAALNHCEKGYDALIFQSCCTDMGMKRRDIPVAMNEGVFPGGREAIWLHAGQHFGALAYSMTLFSRYHLRFDEKIHYSEDKIFILQALYLARSVYIENKLLYLYRQNIYSAMHKRAYGIAYYKPIVDAYLRSDEYTDQYKNEVRGETHAGTVLAGIYIMDMLDEHFQRFRRKKTIDSLINNTAVYQNILNGAITKESYSMRYEQYKKHSLLYIVKNYLRGIIAYLRQIASPVVNRRFGRLRFCVEIESKI